MPPQRITTVADHDLPPGVSRALWEYVHDISIARDYDQFVATSPLMQFDLQLLLKHLNHPGRLIDLGCGTGRLAIPFAEQGFEVVGVDLSREMLLTAREKANDQQLPLALLQANLCQLETFSANTFDYALLMFGTLGMIEGVAHRQAVIGHVGRILKPGGQVALHVHNIWSNLFIPGRRAWVVADRCRARLSSPSAGDRRSPYRGIPGMFMHYFSQGELKSLLRNAGLTIRAWYPLNSRQDSVLGPPTWASCFRAGGWIVIAERQ